MSSVAEGWGLAVRSQKWFWGAVIPCLSTDAFKELKTRTSNTMYVTGDVLAGRHDSIGVLINQAIYRSSFVAESSACDWLWSLAPYPKPLVVLKKPTLWHVKLPEDLPWI